MLDGLSGRQVILAPTMELTNTGGWNIQPRHGRIWILSPDSCYPNSGYINWEPLTAQLYMCACAFSGPYQAQPIITLGEKIKRDAAWVRHLESTEYHTREGKLKQVKMDSWTVQMGIFCTLTVGKSRLLWQINDLSVSFLMQGCHKTANLSTTMGNTLNM